jgi:hypothetical protein
MDNSIVAANYMVLAIFCTFMRNNSFTTELLIYSTQGCSNSTLTPTMENFICQAFPPLRYHHNHVPKEWWLSVCTLTFSELFHQFFCNIYANDIQLICNPWNDEKKYPVINNIKEHQIGKIVSMIQLSTAVLYTLLDAIIMLIMLCCIDPMVLHVTP